MSETTDLPEEEVKMDATVSAETVVAQDKSKDESVVVGEEAKTEDDDRAFVVVEEETADTASSETVVTMGEDTVPLDTITVSTPKTAEPDVTSAVSVATPTESIDATHAGTIATDTVATSEITVTTTAVEPVVTQPIETISAQTETATTSESETVSTSCSETIATFGAETGTIPEITVAVPTAETHVTSATKTVPTPMETNGKSTVETVVVTPKDESADPTDKTGVNSKTEATVVSTSTEKVSPPTPETAVPTNEPEITKIDELKQTKIEEKTDSKEVTESTTSKTETATNVIVSDKKEADTEADIEAQLAMLSGMNWDEFKVVDEYDESEPEPKQESKRPSDRNKRRSPQSSRGSRTERHTSSSTTRGKRPPTSSRDSQKRPHARTSKPEPVKQAKIEMEIHLMEVVDAVAGDDDGDVMQVERVSSGSELNVSSDSQIAEQPTDSKQEKKDVKIEPVTVQKEPKKEPQTSTVMQSSKPTISTSETPSAKIKPAVEKPRPAVEKPKPAVEKRESKAVVSDVSTKVTESVKKPVVVDKPVEKKKSEAVATDKVEQPISTKPKDSTATHVKVDQKESASKPKYRSAAQISSAGRKDSTEDAIVADLRKAISRSPSKSKEQTNVKSTVKESKSNSTKESAPAKAIEPKATTIDKQTKTTESGNVLKPVRTVPEPAITNFIANLQFLEYDVKKYTCFYCVPCHSFLSTTALWEEHLNQTEHKGNMHRWRQCKELKEESKTGSAKKQTDVEKCGQVAVGADHVVEVSGQDGQVRWVCTLCHYVSNNTDRLLQHLSAFSHIDNFMEVAEPALYRPPGRDDKMVDNVKIATPQWKKHIREEASRHRSKKGCGKMLKYSGDGYADWPDNKTVEANSDFQLLDQNYIMERMEQLFDSRPDQKPYPFDYKLLPAYRSIANADYGKPTSESTLIGMQYIMEIWLPSRRIGPVYYCRLCDYIVTSWSLHCNVLKHCVGYLLKHYKTVYECVLLESATEDECRRALTLARGKVLMLEGRQVRVNNVVQLVNTAGDPFVALNANIAKKIVEKEGFSVEAPPRARRSGQTGGKTGSPKQSGEGRNNTDHNRQKRGIEGGDRSIDKRESKHTSINRTPRRDEKEDKGKRDQLNQKDVKRTFPEKSPRKVLDAVKIDKTTKYSDRPRHDSRDESRRDRTSSHGTGNRYNDSRNDDKKRTSSGVRSTEPKRQRTDSGRDRPSRVIGKPVPLFGKDAPMWKPPAIRPPEPPRVHKPTATDYGSRRSDERTRREREPERRQEHSRRHEYEDYKRRTNEKSSVTTRHNGSDRHGDRQQHQPQLPTPLLSQPIAQAQGPTVDLNHAELRVLETMLSQVGFELGRRLTLADLDLLRRQFGAEVVESLIENVRQQGMIDVGRGFMDVSNRQHAQPASAIEIVDYGHGQEDRMRHGRRQTQRNHQEERGDRSRRHNTNYSLGNQPSSGNFVQPNHSIIFSRQPGTLQDMSVLPPSSDAVLVQNPALIPAFNANAGLQPLLSAGHILTRNQPINLANLPPASIDPALLAALQSQRFIHR